MQALNVVLRVTWTETVMHFKVGPIQTRLLDFLLASLEVIRRGHWNFYRYYFSNNLEHHVDKSHRTFYDFNLFFIRLEHEHLNNVGHYRAVKTVPLPFRDADSD